MATGDDNANLRQQNEDTDTRPIQKEQPWLQLREDKVAGKEGERGEPAPGQLHGIVSGQMLLFNGHGGAGRRFLKKPTTPFE